MRTSLKGDIEVRFFVDEDLLAPARALTCVRADVVHPGHHRCAAIPAGTPDSDWLPIVGEAGWVVISRNKKIRSNPVERDLFMTHGVRGVFITTGRALNSFDKLSLIVRFWSSIEGVAVTPGPWMYALTESGLRRIAI